MRSGGACAVCCVITEKPCTGPETSTQGGAACGARFLVEHGAGSAGITRPTTPANDVATSAAALGAPLPGDVIQLGANIISVKYWDRLLGGLLYAVQPRVDWATLLGSAAERRARTARGGRGAPRNCSLHEGLRSEELV